MAVFTEVSADAAGEFLRDLGLGDLVELQGIQGGIENTNYFVTSTHEGQTRQWVLTLFERLSFEQLPFYLYLMKHLAQRGIPVPDPQGNASGDLLHTVCGKPAALVDRLRGRSELAPTEAHCAGVGAALARMHLAGRDYDRSQPNLRGLAWWNETVPVVLPFLDADQAALLQAYAARRPLTAAERRLLPAMLRAGALRFWISRLWDFHLPREASMLQPHDPAHFERVLRQRLAHAVGA